MAKRLYDALKDCKKEEEVKASFCSFFKMKINALKAIDHYTPTVLFEFKYDRNFKSAANIAHVIAQTMYYVRLLKFNLTKYPLPPYHVCDGRARTPAAPQLPYVYDLTVPAEEDQFVAKCREYLLAQMSFLDLLDKKSITEENFLDVFEYWDSLFGKYVKNGRKSSEYGFLNPDVEVFK